MTDYATIGDGDIIATRSVVVNDVAPYILILILWDGSAKCLLHYNQMHPDQLAELRMLRGTIMAGDA